MSNSKKLKWWRLLTQRAYNPLLPFLAGDTPERMEAYAYIDRSWWKALKRVSASRTLISWIAVGTAVVALVKP